MKYYSSVDFTKVNLVKSWFEGLSNRLKLFQAEPIVQKMLVMLQQPQKESMKTIHAKYSHKVQVQF